MDDDDLEMTRLCAEAMGFDEGKVRGDYLRIPIPDAPIYGHEFIYDPLTDDAQAMALVKRFQLSINLPSSPYPCEATWFDPDSDDEIRALNKDLNRAIVECVSKVHVKKGLPF